MGILETIGAIFALVIAAVGGQASSGYGDVKYSGVSGGNGGGSNGGGGGGGGSGWLGSWTGKNGGLYGGGGGGKTYNKTPSSSGAQGIIVITYTPLATFIPQMILT